MPSNDIIVHGSGLDSPLPLRPEALEEVFRAVDGVVNQAVTDGNPDEAIRAGNALIESVQIRGVALMRLLYQLYTVWDMFGLSETFEDRIFAEWGFAKSTIRKYLDIWRAVFENEDVPPELLPALSEKPVRSLERLVRPVNENRLVEPDDWERIAYAPDDSTIRSIVKEIAGVSPRGRPALQFFLYPDGHLYVVLGDDKELLALVKNSPEDQKNKLIARGLERLRSGTGMLEI